ncbi:MAG: lactonase family protein [Staphylococcus epidermidis]|nr:lactonase family protein [Staphylococcus epidermidis]
MTLGYIGSYTKKSGKGIYRFKLNDETGVIEALETGYEIEASTYLTRNESFLYAITKEGEECGVASFSIKEDGQLELINKCLASKQGTGCYIQVSSNGKYLFEAVYGAGLARIYKLNPITGAIEKLIEELEHEFPTGSHERQDSSHVHFLNETPDHKYVVATDLGTDRVVTYKFGEDGLNVHELSNEVSVTEYQDGKFIELERHSTIPSDFNGESKLAAVRLSHDGKHLYISNRGHDSIAIFEVLEDGRSLRSIEIQPSYDAFPRDFNITESDNYLICAHQEGESKVSIFERDNITGKLSLKDKKAIANEGVCVLL